jgi:predicted nucleic-acid-binding Zn-ribbon protein
MANTQQDMRNCSKCRCSTMHIRTVPDTILHVALMFLSAGLWFIVWLLFIHKGSWSCTKCGNVFF